MKGRWRDLSGISGFARSVTRASCEGGGSGHAGEQEDPRDDRYAFFLYLCCARCGREQRSSGSVFKRLL